MKMNKGRRSYSPHLEQQDFEGAFEGSDACSGSGHSLTGETAFDHVNGGKDLGLLQRT